MMMASDQAVVDEQQARALASGVLLVLSLLITLTMVVPAYRALRDAQRATAEARIELERARAVADAYDTLHASVGRSSAAIARAEKALPVLAETGSSDVPALLAAIETVVERDVGGLLLESVHVAPDAELIERGPHVKVRPVTLHGLAGIASLERLLDTLRTSLVLLEPLQVEVAYAGEGVASFTLTLERPVFIP